MVRIGETTLIFLLIGAVIGTIVVMNFDQLSDEVKEGLEGDGGWVGTAKTCAEVAERPNTLCAHYALEKDNDRCMVAITANALVDFVNIVVRFDPDDLEYHTFQVTAPHYNLTRFMEDMDDRVRFNGMLIDQDAEIDEEVHLLTIMFNLKNKSITQTQLENQLEVESHARINGDQTEGLVNYAIVRTPEDDSRVQITDPIPCEGQYTACESGSQRYQVIRHRLNGASKCVDRSNNVVEEGHVRECF